jgi:hypothetical protein
VLLEDDDVGVGDRLLLLEHGEEFVGGRATGAPLGGEELDEDRCVDLWGWRLSREGEGQEQKQSGGAKHSRDHVGSFPNRSASKGILRIVRLIRDEIGHKEVGCVKE